MTDKDKVLPLASIPPNWVLLPHVWLERQRDADWEVYQKQSRKYADVVRYAKGVMDCLEKCGGSIVPHLLDTDENDGEFLRQALAELEEQP